MREECRQGRREEVHGKSSTMIVMTRKNEERCAINEIESPSPITRKLLLVCVCVSFLFFFTVYYTHGQLYRLVFYYFIYFF
mmetsp:Transcript_10795/g.18461  ORF Transcript_10795/g.18461 Transcript_10795/m.18461 type:complete len:81 (-) Transcript_10795:9-251(-)